MNEILAMIVIAFFSETKESSIDQEKYTDEECMQLTNDQVIDILFDEKHVYADIFWCFDRMMSLGVKQLYQVTKDMATLKREVIQEMQMDPPSNTQKNDSKA